MADPTTIEIIKDVISILASAVNILGIIFGIIMAIRAGWLEAPHVPRGNLAHEVIQCQVNETHRLVHVTFSITNIGKTALKPIEEAYTLIQQIKPLKPEFREKLLSKIEPLGVTNTEFDWPKIQRRDYPLKEDKPRIDSGETEKFHCEFLIPSEITAIFAYSMACLDPKDPDLGWDITTFHEFKSA